MWVSAPHTHSRVSNINFDIWKNKLRSVISMNIPWKIYYRRQSSCPLGAYVKSIVRLFNWLKCLGEFLQLKPTAGCEIWTLIFELFFVERGSLLIFHEKYIKDGKVLANLGLKSKVLPGPLTDLSAWVGFCPSSPHQGVKYQLWYAVKYHALGYSLLQYN